MKKSLSFILMGTVLLLFVALPAMAYEDEPYTPEEESQISGKPPGVCPRTNITEKNIQLKCLDCHTLGDWGIKELKDDRYFNYPNDHMKIRDNVVVYKFSKPDAEEFENMLIYLNKHDIKHLIMEISSGGGSMFDAWQIISLMNEWPGTIQTECRDFAASAACLIFMSGSSGYRLISKTKTAVLMWHELGYLKMLDWVTPSSSEDEANINRMLQNIQHEYMAGHCKLSKAELDEKVKRKEFWLTPEEAVKFGFADGFIGK